RGSTPRPEPAPPTPPMKAPSTNPTRRPSRAIRNEAGTVTHALVVAISEYGRVASSKVGASSVPTSPLDATPMDDADRKHAWQIASRNAVRAWGLPVI